MCGNSEIAAVDIGEEREQADGQIRRELCLESPILGDLVSYNVLWGCSYPTRPHQRMIRIFLIRAGFQIADSRVDVVILGHLFDMAAFWREM